jgi:hypothetical protein
MRPPHENRFIWRLLGNVRQRAFDMENASPALAAYRMDYRFRMNPGSRTFENLFPSVQIILKFGYFLLFFLFAEMKAQEKRGREKY